jgi:hypothetical protein
MAAAARANADRPQYIQCLRSAFLKADTAFSIEHQSSGTNASTLHRYLARSRAC